MEHRIGYIVQNEFKIANEFLKKINSIAFIMGIIFVLLIMSSAARAETVTYYLNATSGVDIGADGVTNVEGVNQNIPPIIIALMDKTGLNTNSARTNLHPLGMYNHSRWYVNSNYLIQTKIDENPAGMAILRGSSQNDNVIVRLIDYDSLTGSKILIGSSLPIRLDHSDDNPRYSYTIISPAYIVPRDHRLMLQFDFDQNSISSNARVYAYTYPARSYLTIIETPLTFNVTINTTPSFASIKAGESYVYPITVNNTGNTNGIYTLSVSDSDTTNFSSSVPGLTTLFVPAGGSNQTTLTVTAHGGAPKDAVDTTTVTATSIEDPIYSNSTQTTTTVTVPITYNISIESIPSSASIKAGENFVYSISVNNTGTTNGNYTLSVSDSDITNFSSSVPGLTTLFVPAGGSNQTTLTVTAHGGAPKDAVDTTTVTATSNEDPIYSNSTQTTTTVTVPLTYNVSIESMPSSASILSGENVVYSITVNNTGTTDGSYNLGISDSDATNFSSSLPGLTTLFVPAGGSNQTALTVTANAGLLMDAIDTTTVTATSIEDPIYSNLTQITTTAQAQSLSNCALCHVSYQTAVNNSMHNQTRYAAAPNCTMCHIGYDVQHTGLVVNESNTCRNAGCHVQDVNGFYERHTGSSDCTSCHFANTSRKFERNESLFKHDHNLTVEHSFYEYNQSGGMPLISNNGLSGLGMFPYYSCQFPCHGSAGNLTSRTDMNLEKASSSWLNSSHARSLHMSGDNKNSCAKCKSPTNYNASSPSGNLIAQEDWDGIQCRICHNIHKRNQSTIGPIAFYNSTLSSLAGYAIYESVNSTTALCENCHFGTSHDSKFAGTHKDTAGFNCTNCHMNSSFNNERHKFEVKNTTSGILGCEVCHNPADHIFQFTSNHSGKVTCDACHDRTVSRNATGYAVSSDGKSYGLYLDPATIKVSSWKDSHGSPAPWPLHNITKKVNCDKCHGTYSIFNGSVKQDSLIANEIRCMSCHITPQGPADNPLKYPAIEASLVTKHKNVNNATGADVLDSNDCKTCHYDTSNMSAVLTYSCEECHTKGNFSAPEIKNHRPDGLRIKTDAYCSTCHNNSISNYAYSANASVSHYETNISLIDTSDCILCHNGIYTNNASWGNPQNISTSTKRSHNETQTNQCNLCHKDRSIPSLEFVTFHDAGLQSDINNCMGCHPTVTSADMGGHSILNGTNATDNGDCRACHTIDICPMEIGYSNKSNTYYCYDCHNLTTGGRAPAQLRSRIKWEDKKHGRAECMNCHIADGIYHQNNSRGAVANPDYVNRYLNATYNGMLYNNYTDCADCHYKATLDDAPFYAPSGGEHVITPGIGGNGACVSSCHKSGNTMAKTMHSVATRSIPYRPVITVPVLDQSTVIKGTNVSVTATVDYAYLYAFIDGAQYRIMSGISEIRSWTPMSAVDGDFNATHENVNAIINTDIQPGTYIVEVRGMAGGPAQNWSIPYYPMNGEISNTTNVTLTIQAQMGYINGTVSSGGSNLSGATVYTTGAIDITGSDGKYSLKVAEGKYNVTASKQPKYGENTSIGIDVTPNNTSSIDFALDPNPTGTITGSVTNV